LKLLRPIIVSSLDYLRRGMQSLVIGANSDRRVGLTVGRPDGGEPEDIKGEELPSTEKRWLFEG
jgi:hypothetical protein